MKTGDRLRLIRRIAIELSQREWTEIDVTLRAFDLPWTDQWNGRSDDRLGYCLEMLELGTDAQLSALTAYVDEERTQPEPEPGTAATMAWRDGMFRLFISHLAAHKDFALELKNHLAGHGIDAFVAHEDIRPTKEWENTIRAHLASCEALVALLHEDFFDSEWTDQEIGWALGRGVFVFSVRLGIDPRGFIARYQAIPGVGQTTDQVTRTIVAALQEEKTLADAVLDALVYRLEHARSFREAIDTSKRLESAPLTTEHIERLKAAAKVNSQVNGAYGVASRIDAWAARSVTSRA